MKLEAKIPTEPRLLEYLEANASEALREKIAALPEGAPVNLSAAWDYIQAEARKLLKSKSGMVADDVVWGWLCHYYEDVAAGAAEKAAKGQGGGGGGPSGSSGKRRCAKWRRDCARRPRSPLRRSSGCRCRTAGAFAAAALKRMPLPDGWRVRPIRTVAEFRAEGERMHNCIGTGTYAEKVAQGRAICFAIEGPTPADRHDLELALGKSPRVVQLYGVCNRPPVDVAREIASRVAVAIREAQPKDAEAATEWRAAQ